MSEANEVVDCPVGVVRMLDIDRDFIYRGYAKRRDVLNARGQYYGWPEFVHDALISHAAEEAL